jgi:DNA polymerase-3 subunit delta'
MFADVIGHERQKTLLESAIHHDRVAHAYLFHGEPHIGKRLMALRVAQALNCESPAHAGAPDGCGPCRSCLQIEAQTHPDFLLIEPDPEMANPQIKIEQVREIESQIIYRPLIGRFKIVLIDQADRLTLGAANALLKTLEEPPAHSVFILVTSRPLALPGTIMSRCQCLRFVPPAQTQVEAALILKRNIPPQDARLLALATQARIGEALQAEIASLRQTREELQTLLSPTSLRSMTRLLTVADALAKADRAQEAFEWIAQWCRDLLLVKIGADRRLILNADRRTNLTELADVVRTDLLLDIIAHIEEIQQAATRNLNAQLALETLLLKLRDAVCVPPAAGTSQAP